MLKAVSPERRGTRRTDTSRGPPRRHEGAWLMIRGSWKWQLNRDACRQNDAQGEPRMRWELGDSLRRNEGQQLRTEGVRNCQSPRIRNRLHLDPG